MKYTYIGTDERVIPALGLTVKPGDEFDAPAGLKIHQVIEGNNPVKETTKPTLSAASDSKVGE